MDARATTTCPNRSRRGRGDQPARRRAPAQGQLQQAKDKIDRALEQNPRYGRAHLDRRHAVQPARRPEQGGVALRACGLARAEDPEFKNNYAVYLCQQKKYERGQKLALEAAADPLYKTPEVAYVNAGNCALSAGA